jgi:hypothetical protein
MLDLDQNNLAQKDQARKMLMMFYVCAKTSVYAITRARHRSEVAECCSNDLASTLQDMKLHNN